MTGASLAPVAELLSVSVTFRSSVSVTDRKPVDFRFSFLGDTFLLGAPESEIRVVVF